MSQRSLGQAWDKPGTSLGQAWDKPGTNPGQTWDKVETNNRTRRVNRRLHNNLPYSIAGIEHTGTKRTIMRKISILACITFLTIAAKAQPAPAPAPPREWIDPDTGHKIVRLSDEAGSSTFYFHQNAYTASGDKVV